MVDDPVTDADLEFLRELVGLTQAGKLHWVADREGGYAATRPRVTAVLQRPSAGVRPTRAIQLVLRRTASSDVSQTLRQQIDDAPPHPVQLALNSLLAYLWQLVSQDKRATGLYTDFMDDEE